MGRNSEIMNKKIRRRLKMLNRAPTEAYYTKPQHTRQSPNSSVLDKARNTWLSINISTKLNRYWTEPIKYSTQVATYQKKPLAAVKYCYYWYDGHDPYDYPSIINTIATQTHNTYIYTYTSNVIYIYIYAYLYVLLMHVMIRYICTWYTQTAHLL